MSKRPKELDLTVGTVDVLDCTLRDGSYVIDFQFTADDTREIVAGLAAAGFQWIEVGHGLGLGAQSQMGRAGASDEAYIEAALAVAGPARIGCFYITGIGNAQQMASARALGLDFIRIGTNASEVDASLADITAAREFGLHVSSNLMKSYVLRLPEIAECTKKAAAAGAERVVMVDSAGGMLPSDVRDYIRAMKDAVPVPIGFHGHNNLGLANGCALAALEAGAEVIDCTLQGIGRSAGNACTETLVLALARQGYQTGIDPFAVIELGERLIRPRLGRAGISGVQAVSGYAQFHSSFMRFVDEAAVTFGVDRREVIVEVSKIDRTRPSRQLFLDVAARLQERQKPT